MHTFDTYNFIGAIAGSQSTPVTIQTFDDTDQKRPELARVFHDQIDNLLPELQKLNTKGAGIFLTISETDLKGRKSENIKSIRALFVDSDTGPIKRFKVEPSIIVKSCNGDHAYWLLNPNQPCSDFTQAQKSLIKQYSTDKYVTDISRVMRIPGFLHMKDPAHPYMVELDKCDPRLRYNISDLVSTGKKIQPGNRNNTLFKEAAKARGNGLGIEDILRELERINREDCAEPLKHRELEIIAGSAAKYEPNPKIEQKEKLSVKQKKPAKINPNDIALSILKDHKIVRDANCNLYSYQDSFWDLCSIENIKSLALKYDSHKDTTDRRRNESARYCAAICHQQKSITWNNIKHTEIPFKNGVLNFQTGELRPHKADDYLDRILPHDYDPNRGSGIWDELLYDWFGGDSDFSQKVSALQEFFGYTLLSHASYKKALILYGPSDTGKSQVAGVLQEICGHKNVCGIGLAAMGDSRKIAPIRGKFLNIINEIPEDELVADGGFKNLVSTGRELIQIDEKWKAQIMYMPTCKHVFCTNSLPQINDRTRAVFNRLLVVKFNRVFAVDQQDRGLNDRLLLEVPGIINWAIQGVKRLTQNAGEFTTIQESEEILETHRAEQNPLQLFIEEQMIVNPGLEIQFSKIRSAFNSWHGGHEWGEQSISRCLNAMGFSKRRRTKSCRFVSGLGFSIGDTVKD